MSVGLSIMADNISCAQIAVECRSFALFIAIIQHFSSDSSSDVVLEPAIYRSKARVLDVSI